MPTDRDGVKSEQRCYTVGCFGPCASGRRGFRRWTGRVLREVWPPTQAIRDCFSFLSQLCLFVVGLEMLNLSEPEVKGGKRRRKRMLM